MNSIGTAHLADWPAKGPATFCLGHRPSGKRKWWPTERLYEEAIKGPVMFALVPTLILRAQQKLSNSLWPLSLGAYYVAGRRSTIRRAAAATIYRPIYIIAGSAAQLLSAGDDSLCCSISNWHKRARCDASIVKLAAGLQTQLAKCDFFSSLAQID